MFVANFLRDSLNDLDDFSRQVMATLEVGPKSNLVIYEMMPTRRRKAIPVHVASQHHEEAVALAFSADAKLLATLLPEQLQKEHSHAADLPVSSLNLSNTTSPTARHQSYSITVYLWRTGKTLASVSLGLPSLPAANPQVCKKNKSCLLWFSTFLTNLLGE